MQGVDQMQFWDVLSDFQSQALDVIRVVINSDVEKELDCNYGRPFWLSSSIFTKRD